ncbi:hypothetical protein NKI94_31730 [Mesorhizobium australicum]|uniref:hypothetical protein n=1 Tax=Mesorhizobium australicum TaxID=536018 RepID=UPI00333A44EE
MTDDMALSGPGGEERLNFEPERLAGDLADLTLDRVPHSPNRRAAVVFSGAGIADAAIAALVYRRAGEAGKGVLLPL